LGARICGATLIGDRVTSICGPFFGSERVGDRYAGACGASCSAEAGGGGGGGAGGGRGAALVESAVVGVVVGDVDVATVGLPPLSEDVWNSSRTADTTSAAAANAAALSMVTACRLRYHGVGAGLKFQVLALNASNRSSSAHS
jgi:hypothetical protein